MTQFIPRPTCIERRVELVEEAVGWVRRGQEGSRSQLADRIEMAADAGAHEGLLAWARDNLSREPGLDDTR